jgi:SAM-dependent methyltransferase
MRYSQIASALLPLFVVATVALAMRDRPVSAAAPSAAPAASVFADIYRDGTWAKDDAGAGTSGLGSTLEATALYREYLRRFMHDHTIASVVDAGCGDWEFSKAIDWTGIDYRGFDIVPAVIAADTAAFEKANVHFAVANIVTDELPAADLLIVKHVLQHLPNDDVKKAIARMGRYKHVLLVDTVNPLNLSAENRDITVGSFRFFDPAAPPFNLPAVKELTWWDGHHMQQVARLSVR